jgi:transposase
LREELKRKGVTLQLLWLEYKTQHPDGYQYTQFCEHYRTWAATLGPALRQVHGAGERVFVDYAGPTMPVFDGPTGEERAAQVFVAALGASHLLYAEATWTQTLPDWIGAHVRILEYYGGVPALIVPDNASALVRHPCYARLLRAGPQPDVSGFRHALRDGDSPDAGPESARQGESRDGRLDRRARDHGAAAA